MYTADDGNGTETTENRVRNAKFKTRQPAQAHRRGGGQNGEKKVKDRGTPNLITFYAHDLFRTKILSFLFIVIQNNIRRGKNWQKRRKSIFIIFAGGCVCVCSVHTCIV